MEEINFLTLQLAKKYTDEHGGGGGGGTSNYNDLSNKPQIGGVTLSGNKSASDLGLVAAVDGKGLSTNDYTDADKAIVDGVTAALEDKADKSSVKNEFIGTLDEWNALTVEQRKAYDTYQIKGDYTEGSGGLPDYSTTEQKTGQKWIDGRDIYSKTEQYTIPSDVAVGITKFQTAIPTNASVLNAEVRVEIETGILSIASYTPWWTSATTIYAGLDSSGVGIYFGGNFYAGKPIYVTLFYVKTA